MKKFLLLLLIIVLYSCVKRPYTTIQKRSYFKALETQFYSYMPDSTNRYSMARYDAIQELLEETPDYLDSLIVQAQNEAYRHWQLGIIIDSKYSDVFYIGAIPPIPSFDTTSGYIESHYDHHNGNPLYPLIYSLEVKWIEKKYGPSPLTYKQWNSFIFSPQEFIAQQKRIPILKDSVTTIPSLDMKISLLPFDLFDMFEDEKQTIEGDSTAVEDESYDLLVRTKRQYEFPFSFKPPHYESNSACFFIHGPADTPLGYFIYEKEGKTVTIEVIDTRFGNLLNRIPVY